MVECTRLRVNGRQIKVDDYFFKFPDNFHWKNQK